jgi:hypothetical protein
LCGGTAPRLLWCTAALKGSFSRSTLASAAELAYTIAPVAQRFTQAGSPPHRSQMRARPVSGCRATMPKGQASTQAEQPLQSSARRSTAPVLSSLYRASVGQAATQGGRPHRRHTCGSSTPSGSFLLMRMRAVVAPKRPSCQATQATSQARQPLQRSARTRILFKIASVLLPYTPRDTFRRGRTDYRPGVGPVKCFGNRSGSIKAAVGRQGG